MDSESTNGGSVPVDWKGSTLGAEVDLLTGYPFPSEAFSRSGFRLVRGSNVKRGKLDWSEDITEYWSAATTKLKRYELQAGDLLIAMDGALVGRSFATVTAADLPALLVQRVARLRARTAEPYLLGAWVGSDHFVKHVDLVKTHTAIPHISPRDIRGFALSVPTSPAEQSAIATALSDVDALLGALDRLIAKKRDLKQAAMQQLLTGQTRLPGFSGEWDAVEFGEVATVRNAKVVASATPLATRCVELDGMSQGTGRLLGCVAATGPSSKYTFKLGDVLFGRLRAYLRKFWLATFDGICSTEIWPLIPRDERLRGSFLHLVVQTEEFVDAAGIAYGTHMPRSDWSVLRKVQVQLPPPSEQSAIATLLSDFDAEIEALEARRAKTRALKQAMMQELLTGRTRLV